MQVGLIALVGHWQIDWHTDFCYPLMVKWAERVRAASSSDKLVFLETLPNEVSRALPFRYVLW